MSHVCAVLGQESIGVYEILPPPLSRRATQAGCASAAMTGGSR